MRAGFLTTAAGLLALVRLGAAMTPAGVLPKNTEDLTNYYDTSTLATNGVNVAKASTSFPSSSSRLFNFILLTIKKTQL